MYGIIYIEARVLNCNNLQHIIGNINELLPM